MLIIRDRIVKSGDCIFDLNKEDAVWLYGSLKTKSIQDILWQVKLNRVVEAEIFIAK